MTVVLFHKNISKYIIALFLFGLFPFFAQASASQFVFTSAPSSLASDDASCKFTVQSQNSNNESVPVGSTFDITYTTTSDSGTFSTNNTTWTPITSRTMASNSANINFYYKDTIPGIVTLSVSATERANPTNTFLINTDVTIGETSVCDSSTQTESGGSGATSSGGGSSITFFKQDERIEEKKPKKPTTFTASLKREPTITAHTPTRFLPTILEDEIKTIKVGRFVWTMGDGTQYENKNSEVLYHTYEYPGEYLLVLDFYQTVFDEYPTATLRTKISVYEPSLIIEEKTSDGIIVLKNTSKFDIDTTGWSLISGNIKYSLPNRTTILSGSTLKLPASKTSIPLFDSKPITLYAPNQIPIDTWASSTPVQKIATQANPIDAFTPLVANDKIEESFFVSEDTSFSDTADTIHNTLSAQANTPNKSSQTALYMIGFIGIILSSIGGMIFLIISNKKSTSLDVDSIDEIQIIE